MVDSDVIVVGAGLAGLVATAELADAGRRVLLLDQEPAANLGGQAFWSFGGLFLVGSPEQRRTGIKDSFELARQDWLGSAGFDRGIDDPAARTTGPTGGPRRTWTSPRVRSGPGCTASACAGCRWCSGPSAAASWPTGTATRCPGSTSPGAPARRWSAPFARRVRAAASQGRVQFGFRHRVDELTVTNGAVDGVRGAILEPSSAARGHRSSRTETGQFELHAPVVLVTSGGIGANHELVRQNWPARLGPAPERMISGVPDYVDGRMLAITERAGGRIVNPDRMWHYTEGIQNWDPIWAGARHPGPARAVLAVVRRPRPAVPGAELPRLRHAEHAAGHRPVRLRLLLVRARPSRSSRRSSRSPARSRTPT